MRKLLQAIHCCYSIIHPIKCEAMHRALVLMVGVSCTFTLPADQSLAKSNANQQHNSVNHATGNPPAPANPPKAENMDLDAPVQPMPSTPAIVDDKSGEDSPESIVVAIEPLVILGTEVPPNTSTRLSWSPSQSFEGIAAPTPVLVLNGSKPGPTLCLTAAIHGDELNGIEIVRRVMYNLETEKLSGSLIGVPIVNLQGFHRTSRYLTDRRDLNRYFPGKPEGSSAARIAHSFFNEVIAHCDALVDLHTGSFHRTNLPQLRADLTNPQVLELTQGFGATVTLHNAGALGTLRRAATDAGIPTVTLESGAPMQLQEKAVSHGVKGIQTLLNKLGMYKKVSLWGAPEPVYYRSTWVRVSKGGILFSQVSLGQRVKKGALLGTVTNPITNIREQVLSPYRGRVLGMAINQMVQPGFAAYRIGIQTDDDSVVPSNIDPEAEPPFDNIEDEEPEPDLATSETSIEPNRNGPEDSE